MNTPKIAAGLFGQARMVNTASFRHSGLRGTSPGVPRLAITRPLTTWSRSSTSGHSSGRLSGNREWYTLSLTGAVLIGLITTHLIGATANTVQCEQAPSSVVTPTSLPLPDPKTEQNVDPDTKQALPLYLPTPASALPSGTGPLKLVGLGVRSVSFLRVRVYVAGFYVDEHKLHQLSLEGGFSGEEASLEQRIRQLIDEGTVCAIRIVPVRSTDFAHLRDGFVRALQGRLKKALKASSIASGSNAEESFSQGIQEVKNAFPRGSVPKGSALDLVLVPSSVTRAASLHFEYDGKVFGQVQPASSSSSSLSVSTNEASFTVARELALAYFAESGEISTPLKKSVEEGVASIAGGRQVPSVQG